MGGRLQGKVAIITGGARGMGLATARLFVAEGAKVVIADVLDQGQAAADALGDAAHFVRLDVSKEEGWRALDRQVRDHFGAAHILVNNAGIIRAASVLDFELADFESVMQVNLIGTFLGIKTIAPGMIEQGGGSIINISSTEGLQGTNGMAAYGASKWASRGLTKIAAVELMPLGVRVNSVHPGPVRTDLGDAEGFDRSALDEMIAALPVRREADAAEIARVSLFLASDDASYMCGAELVADGGMTIGGYMPFMPGMPER